MASDDYNHCSRPYIKKETRSSLAGLSFCGSCVCKWVFCDSLKQGALLGYNFPQPVELGLLGGAEFAHFGVLLSGDLPQLLHAVCVLSALDSSSAGGAILAANKAIPVLYNHFLAAFLTPFYHRFQSFCALFGTRRVRCDSCMVISESAARCLHCCVYTIERRASVSGPPVQYMLSLCSPSATPHVMEVVNVDLPGGRHTYTLKIVK